MEEDFSFEYPSDIFFAFVDSSILAFLMEIVCGQGRRSYTSVNLVYIEYCGFVDECQPLYKRPASYERFDTVFPCGFTYTLKSSDSGAI